MKVSKLLVVICVVLLVVKVVAVDVWNVVVGRPVEI